MYAYYIDLSNSNQMSISAGRVRKNADNQTKNYGLSGVSGDGRRKLMSDLDPAGKK